MNFFKLFKKQLKSNPITILLFIIIFYISSLGLSVLVSTISKFSSKSNEYYESFDKNTLLGTFTYVNNNYNNNDMITFLSNLESDVKFRTSFEYFKINDVEYRDVVISDYFKNSWDITYPILSGRFYTADEIKNCEKVILLGKNIAEKYLNNKDTIKIDNELYKVIGIVGYEESESTFDNNVFIPLTSLSKMTLNSFESIPTRSIFLTGKTDFPLEEMDKLETYLQNIDPNTTLAHLEKFDGTTANVSDGILVYSGEVIVVVMCMIFSILNMILINYFWIKDRRFEIGVRKAFGIKDNQIASLLICEFLSIVTIASILAIVSQFILSILLNNIDSYSLDLSIYNFVAIISFNILISILVSAIPICKAIKISPIEIVKGE